MIIIGTLFRYISNMSRCLAFSDKEHNNQIVPEIFYEIDHSQFLVVDIIYPNNDAYFEAGYAVSADDILPLRGNEWTISRHTVHLCVKIAPKLH